MRLSKYISQILFTIAVGISSYSICIGQYTYNDDASRLIVIDEEKEINTKNMEFSPFYYRDKVGFVTSGKRGKKDKETGDYYFDLGYSAKDINDELSRKALFVQGINSDMHEGPAEYDHANGLIYFTRSWYDTKKGTSRDTVVMQIMQATERNDYKRAKTINISSYEYSICHPTLSRDGNTMIFSSNMPGSAKMDLYVSTKEGTKWTEPQRISSAVNSPYNEVFPRLVKDSILLFSTDHPEGSGGLDVWYSIRANGIWLDPVPLPRPINTAYDDFGLIMSQDFKSGYLSSNREGGRGKDDIYRWSCELPLYKYADPPLLIDTKISIVDKLLFTPISNVQVTIAELLGDGSNFNLGDFDVDMINGDNSGELIMKLTPKRGASVDTIYTDQEGFATTQVLEGKRYVLTMSADGYETQSIFVDAYDIINTLELVLNPKEQKQTTPPPTPKPKPTPSIIIPTTKDAVIVFENIYYEHNSAAIKGGAAIELDALHEAMVINPFMKIQLSAHTDATGPSQYNQQLSQQRALSAKRYLTDRGINTDRIVAVGYGETAIRNHCTNGVKCSENEHRYNRRTEVKILEN